ncbi:MAG: hypothetical protein K0S27_266 [Gammaproteobacteria bacterium]|jgi:hypothetical protein|nr:hypothetical protein [Gammaproteobacteria bacterium]
MNILVNSTAVALWYEIIHEAEKSCAITLNKEIESYLVFLMMRYLTQPEVVKHIMAHEFLAGMQSSAAQRQLALQGVGDKCLLFAGLFPNLAEKRLVKISYFVQLGQSAYNVLARSRHDIYALLGKQFVTLMDILQSVRQHTYGCPDLLPLQAYDLWNETGSRRAFSILKQYTSATPLKSPVTEMNEQLFIKKD